MPSEGMEETITCVRDVFTHYMERRRIALREPTVERQGSGTIVSRAERQPMTVTE